MAEASSHRHPRNDSSSPDRKKDYPPTGRYRLAFRRQLDWEILGIAILDWTELDTDRFFTLKLERIPSLSEACLPIIGGSHEELSAIPLQFLYNGCHSPWFARLS